jgi:cysteinyl-tRNA synthetase
VQLTAEKRHANDFALWFSDKPRHIMQWDSPWGRGYPGWHVECSAMAVRYLGPTFDIHCGGVDHIPVHHTNEIAQSECATGQPFARYWMHGEWLLIGSDKMSKSTENFLTLEVLGQRGYDPLSYRHLCLQAHYRSELRFTWDALDAAQHGLRRIYGLGAEDDPLNDPPAYQDARAEVLSALNNDLNVPQGLGLLNRYASRRLWLEFDQVLGLDIEARSRKRKEALEEEALAIVAQRNQARAARNWPESDRLRALLIEMGYEVGDGPAGTTITRKPI